MTPTLAENGFALLEGVHATEQQLASYENCPHDPFMGNGTRYKRFSQFRLACGEDGWTAELLPRRDYSAPKRFNPVGGGMRRPYEPIEADFAPIVTRLAGELALDPSVVWQINVHQNRSVADAARAGQLTPEGRHQDGHEFVSISVFARRGVTGGHTRIWADRTGDTPLWEHTLGPGETVLLDDRAVLHDVTDIESAGEGRGTRDILIVAYSRWEERWYGDEHDRIALET